MRRRVLLRVGGATVGPGPNVVPEPEGGDRPWERLGGVRRDCRPHHGTRLRLLGLTSLVFGILALCGGVTGLLGLSLGITTCVLARRELAGISAGIVDPAGRRPAEEASSLGLMGVLLSLNFLVCYGLLLASVLLRSDVFW